VAVDRRYGAWSSAAFYLRFEQQNFRTAGVTEKWNSQICVDLVHGQKLRRDAVVALVFPENEHLWLFKVGIAFSSPSSI
jgi:hypothetical protein